MNVEKELAHLVRRQKTYTQSVIKAASGFDVVQYPEDSQKYATGDLVVVFNKPWKGIRLTYGTITASYCSYIEGTWVYDILIGEKMYELNEEYVRSVA